MVCQRPECPEILCRRLVAGAYLCEGCWDELLRFKATWPETMQRADVKRNICGFLKVSPGSHTKISREEVDEEFNRLVRDGYDDE